VISRIAVWGRVRGQQFGESALRPCGSNAVLPGNRSTRLDLDTRIPSESIGWMVCPSCQSGPMKQAVEPGSAGSMERLRLATGAPDCGRARGNHGRQPLRTRPDWQGAIWKAVLASPGRGHYSHLPLSLLGKPTDWDWPSLDHLSSPATAEVVLEVRLVNDMKTIMNDQEFREMVGHLAAVLKIRPKKLRKNWHCRRGFAIEEPPTNEPPLPDTTPG
jgi:hypothetical protein